MKSTSLNLNDIVQTLDHYKNNSSYNSMRKNLNVIAAYSIMMILIILVAKLQQA